MRKNPSMTRLALCTDYEFILCTKHIFGRFIDELEHFRSEFLGTLRFPNAFWTIQYGLLEC